ncbi:MAG: hypothetical protein GX587_06155, partial [Bacteroidales bacterium]|nr:hypothetical protein [Bacteroidales bacterium]
MVITPGNQKGGASVKFYYRTNLQDEVVLWEVNSANNLIKSGFYQPSTLYKNEVKDENYNINIEFKNKQGQVVLKRSYSSASQKHDTYYVYDDFGLLRYVLSPMASYNMTGNSYTPETQIVKNYCYYYEYNNRKLMVKKQLPGAGYVTMEYDNRDRLVYSIDANQRAKGQKIKIEYDNLNRPIKRILISPNNGPETPGASSTLEDELEVTKYDDYTGVPSQLAFANVSGMGQYFVKSNNVRGLVTYNKKKSLDDERLYLETAMYYDKYGRLIQTVSTNHLGGIDRISNDLDFSGKVLQTITQHYSDLSQFISLKEIFSYDHAGRLLNTKLYINNFTSPNGSNSSQITYDDLGRVSKKALLQSGSVTYKQYQKFQYNIRGWLTHINNPDSLGSAYFAQKLLYETGTNAQHNGNISAEEWRSPGLTQKYRYDYQYDGLNRIKNASFTPASRYNMSWSYDLNGNIQNQKRSGKPQDQGFGTGSELFIQVENLYYNYNGNQLLSVNNRLLHQLPNGFKDNA